MAEGRSLLSYISASAGEAVLHMRNLQLKTQGYLSEPARSTKLSLPRVTFWVCRLVASMMTLMMRWLREDSLFICVEDTCRCVWPCTASHAKCCGPFHFQERLAIKPEGLAGHTYCRLQYHSKHGSHAWPSHMRSRHDDWDHQVRLISRQLSSVCGCALMPFMIPLRQGSQMAVGLPSQRWQAAHELR